jgi:uncharacterized protein
MDKRDFIYRLNSLEVRAADDGSPVIAGYAAIYDVQSVVMWPGFREIIAPGAFTATLQSGRDVRALWNHNSDFPLARRKNGSLTLWEDSTGLGFEMHPIRSMLTDHFIETIRSGVVDGMSFGFVIEESDLSPDRTLQTLHRVTLEEISPTAFPAYPQTSAEVRSVYALGDIPILPELQIGRSADPGDAELARARLALKRRKLELVKHRR